MDPIWRRCFVGVQPAQLFFYFVLRYCGVLKWLSEVVIRRHWHVVQVLLGIHALEECVECIGLLVICNRLRSIRSVQLFYPGSFACLRSDIGLKRFRVMLSLLGDFLFHFTVCFSTFPYRLVYRAYVVLLSL